MSSSQDAIDAPHQRYEGTAMRTIIISALFAIAASGASAQEIIEFDDAFVSQKSRAEVMAEVSRAQARGMMQQQGEITWTPPITESPDRSRAVVRDEARHAASMNERGTLYDPRYHN